MFDEWRNEWMSKPGRQLWESSQTGKRNLHSSSTAKDGQFCWMYIWWHNFYEERSHCSKWMLRRRLWMWACACVCVCVRARAHVHGHGHTHRRDWKEPVVAFRSYCANSSCANRANSSCANSLHNHKQGVQCFLEAPRFHGKSMDRVWNQVDKTTNLWLTSHLTLTFLNLS